MAKLDPISTLKMRRDKATQIINEQKTAGRSEDAKVFLDKWRLENIGTTNSGALPPVDAVPYHLRGIIFKRADASSTDTKTAAFTQKQMDGLNKVFPGAEGRINDFRKKQFNMGPMKIKPGVQLPDLASNNRPIPSQMSYVTEKGWFLDGTGKAYQQRGGVFGGGTEYNPDIHGLPVPLVKNKTQDGLKIASKKDDEINRQLILNSGGANPEDYLTPKQLQRYNDDPSKFIDIDIDLVKNKDQNLAWLRSSGSGAMTNNEFKEGLRIINSTSPNESVRNARELLLIKQAAGGV